ncbi:anaerobic ribonucleoside-triphosphate reductase [Lacrimispora amygdalina]|uniref:anaerobic ribonucleoside-triphosphate reductase n=1 Tax=Lacrimispora amygdalina TaxID=253257 RepID=UPI001FA8357E|nr:anaerobic ribonucleoside-triphosphate reductase [Lacrimispora amygdalina]
MNSLFDLNKIVIIKKNGTKEKFDSEKIIIATQKSANRIAKEWTNEEKNEIVRYVIQKIEESQETEFHIETIHSIVEYALEKVNPKVANQYRSYRNWKQKGLKLFDEMEQAENTIRYIGDRSNANKDAKLVATKRSLLYGEYSTKRYEQFFLNEEEKQATKDGFFYINDKDSRLDTWNCCLFDMANVLRGGFQMGNMWYNEPNSLDTAFDVMGDIILSTAAQQYGGFTVPEVDTVLLPYANKSYNNFYSEKYNEIYESEMETIEYLKEHHAFYLPENKIKLEQLLAYAKEKAETKAKEYAFKKTQRECEQGMQGIEYKLNTVGSSRGDYPFTTFTLGLSEGKLGKMITKTILNVRKEGQGKKGFKKPVLFPKLVFLYDEEKHGAGKEYEDVFDGAISCSSKTMYPDYLSLTGEGYVPEMYKKFKRVVSPMGCRAFLSPWYEKGGIYQSDPEDKPIFTGRFNLGVVTLHLPMILMKSMKEKKDFYEVLDYYMELIRKFHKRTIDYIGNLRAGGNPMCFCEGGMLGGNLRPDEKIASLLKSCTISFGITALNELQMLYNGKSIREDGKFALEVMEHINNLVDRYKKEDGILYAIYGTPAETLAGKQIEQFRTKYGVVEGVSSKEFVTNSFHDAVWETITPIQKQDDEKRFWNLSNGGKIQYCKYPIQYNLGAIKTLVRRAMKIGFYEGVNLSLSYCNHCGHEELNMTICSHCGSKNITMIDRMNGYLGFTRVGTIDGDFDFDSDPEKTSRFNKSKVAELGMRVSM